MPRTIWSRAQGSGKNVRAQVNGFIPAALQKLNWEMVVDMEALDTTGKAYLRLDSISYAIGDGLELQLAWDKEGDDVPPHVFLPLSGRGHINFGNIEGLVNTVDEGRNGNVLVRAVRLNDSCREIYFTLALDFDKQGI